MAIWKIATPDPKLADYAKLFNVQPFLAQVLLNRGITDSGLLDTYLNGSMKNLFDPMLIPNMKYAALRIVKAIEAKEEIVIYGDYDVDGITGTVTLYLLIKMLGGEVSTYIPHRTEEGYGLHDESVRELCQLGAKLIISVDCGITAVGPAKVAREMGVDLIITDHHEWKDEFPDCYAIVHPAVDVAPAASVCDGMSMPSGYPNHHLCGSGVAFKLAWAIAKNIHGGERCVPFLNQALAFTALGTIADIVPLKGENRVIAQVGLRQVAGTCFPGLQALTEVSRTKAEGIDAYKVGFVLAPRLNAAGRMGHAKLALAMLLEENHTKALKIAQDLEFCNLARQKEQETIVQEAEEQAKAAVLTQPTCSILVLTHSNWHPGIVGIVASRIVEKFHRPTLILRKGDRSAHGSGRSVEGFHLTKALTSCGDLIAKFGGHAMACGVQIPIENLDAVKKQLNDYAAEHLTPDMCLPSIKVDCVANLEDMTETTVLALRRIGPFGMGNRKPHFLFRNVRCGMIIRMGKTGQFLSWFGEQGEATLKCVCFKPTPQMMEMAGQDGSALLDIVGEPEINEYRGKTTVNILVQDFRLSEVGGPEASLF